MKITKKVKIAIIFIWIAAILSMIIGTVIIGRYFITGTYGRDRSLQLLYSENDPWERISIILSWVPRR